MAKKKGAVKPTGGSSAKALLARTRETRAVEMRLAGSTLDEIAIELGYAAPACARAAIIRCMEKMPPPEKLEELRAREIAKMNEVEAEAWQQWLRSTENAVCVTTTTGVDEPGDEAEATESEPSKKVVKEEGQSGNPALLDKIIKASERRAKLLGLDRPQEVNLNSGLRVIGKDPATVFEEAAKRARRQKSDGSGG